ncbi:MAG: DNA primase family protein [Minisyncoccia bacterium]
MRNRQAPLDVIIEKLSYDLSGLPDWLPDVIVDGDRDGAISPRAMVQQVVRVLFHDGQVPDDAIIAMLLHPDMGISKLVLAQPDGAEFVREALKQLRRDSGRTYHLLDRRDWSGSAAVFGRECRPLLRHYNGDFYDWTDGAYHSAEDAGLEAEVRDFLHHAKCRVFNKKAKAWDVQPFKPGKRDIGELIDALRHTRHMSRDKCAPPSWLDDEHLHMPAAECIAFRNGVLHLPSGQFVPPTPSFFTFNAVEFEYDSNAQCPVWLRTLDQYWPREVDGAPAAEVQLLQEVLGYLISADTSAQKLFFMLGPPRSGKGVTSRVIVKLIGKANVTSTSLHSLGGEFGRQPLIGKQLALIAETKLSPKDNEGAITGYLLAISGEDSQSVNRKNKEFWEGKLSVRFLWLGNKIPTFVDDGTALGNRLVILRMTESFLGREDFALEASLHAELPGIMNWAIEGWKRLKARGYFEETDSGRDAKMEFIRLASPTLGFVQERCRFDDNAAVGKDKLYQAFRAWCSEQNRVAESKTQFSTNLMTCCAGRVQSYRPKSEQQDGPRQWHWRGIALESGPQNSARQHDGSDSLLPGLQSTQGGHDGVPF